MLNWGSGVNDADTLRLNAWCWPGNSKLSRKHLTSEPGPLCARYHTLPPPKVTSGGPAVDVRLLRPNSAAWRFIVTSRGQQWIGYTAHQNERIG